MITHVLVCHAVYFIGSHARCNCCTCLLQSIRCNLGSLEHCCNSFRGLHKRLTHRFLHSVFPDIFWTFNVVRNLTDRDWLSRLSFSRVLMPYIVVPLEETIRVGVQLGSYPGFGRKNP